MEDVSCNFIFLEVQAPHNLKNEDNLINEDNLKDEDDFNNENDLNALNACNAAPTVKFKMFTGGPQKLLELG